MLTAFTMATIQKTVASGPNQPRWIPITLSMRQPAATAATRCYNLYHEFCRRSQRPAIVDSTRYHQDRRGRHQREELPSMLE